MVTSSRAAADIIRVTASGELDMAIVGQLEKALHEALVDEDVMVVMVDFHRRQLL